MASSFARYPKPKLRPFLLEVFSAWGCRVESTPGVIEVELTRSLQKRFGRRKLRLLLGKGKGSSGDSGELMVPGNPVYRAVLNLARRKGELGSGFASMPKRQPAPSTVAKAVGRAIALNGASFRVLVREDEYHPILLFHFSLSFGAPEVPDEIRTVGWDVVANEAIDPAPFAPGGLSLANDPVEGIKILGTDDIAAVFEGAEAALEAQISKKVARTEARAKKQLDKESARIESFYRRMIQEAKSRPRPRNGDDADLPHKIELYQLDWKRKLSEATERLKPRINVRLFCIEEAHVPRRRAALIVPEAGSPERVCYYDYLTKEVLGPTCDSCDHRSPELSVCQGGHLCCSLCVRKCEVCEESFCQRCWSDSWDAQSGRAGRDVDPSAMMKMDPGCAGVSANRRRGSSK